jgi:hypothetical protein
MLERLLRANIDRTHFLGISASKKKIDFKQEPEKILFSSSSAVEGKRRSFSRCWTEQKEPIMEPGWVGQVIEHDAIRSSMLIKFLSSSNQTKAQPNIIPKWIKKLGLIEIVIDPTRLDKYLHLS